MRTTNEQCAADEQGQAFNLIQLGSPSVSSFVCTIAVSFPSATVAPHELNVFTLSRPLAAAACVAAAGQLSWIATWCSTFDVEHCRGARCWEARELEDFCVGWSHARPLCHQVWTLNTRHCQTHNTTCSTHIVKYKRSSTNAENFIQVSVRSASARKPHRAKRIGQFDALRQLRRLLFFLLRPLVL